ALANAIGGFLDAHRDLRIELVMRDSVGDLVADGFDLALRFGEPPAGRFIAAKLVETRILTVLSPSYLAARRRPPHPSEVVPHACIDFWDERRGLSPLRVLSFTPSSAGQGARVCRLRRRNDQTEKLAARQTAFRARHCALGRFAPHEAA